MGAGSHDSRADLEVGQGVHLVGMKQGDLEGCREIIEEVQDRKAQVLLVESEASTAENTEAEN